eukprot:9369570-Ditylum_brightwellii.AAC.1
MAQTNKTKKKQHIAQAKRIHKGLTNLLKNKNPNILHCVSLLNSEKAALKQKRNQEDARKLYNDAEVNMCMMQHWHMNGLRTIFPAVLGTYKRSSIILKEQYSATQTGVHWELNELHIIL